MPANIKTLSICIDNNGGGTIWYDDAVIRRNTAPVSEIVEESNYYPFGMKQEGYNNVPRTDRNLAAQRYKYNSKEYQDELGLNWYDYGARNYDPTLGKWFSVDQMAEEYYEDSPYIYGFNNPIRHIDPDGNSSEDVVNIDPPKKKKSASTGTIKSFSSLNSPKYQGAYVGESLDNLVTAGIQWLGEKISGSEVSKETSENIQLLTNVAVVIVSKGKNAKADAELGEQLTKGEGKAISSRAARREAMRKEGIPTSQQPKSQSKNASGREYSYDVPKKGGGTQTKSVQQQTMDRSHKGQPHWEAGKVKTNNGQVRTNSHGRPKLQNDKSKVDY